MGNILFCEKCEKTESVISLSDKCTGKLTNDECRKCEEGKYKGNKLDDDTWSKKLKCIDDVHTNGNGLTFPCIQELFRKVETEIGTVNPPTCCSAKLLGCLKETGCTIKCKKYIDEFIDCVDTYRIEVIKQRFEKELEDRKIEVENQLAKKLLSK